MTAPAGGGGSNGRAGIVKVPLAPLYQNGITDTGGGNAVGSYWVDALGLVHIEGCVTQPGNAALYFTLPLALAPAKTHTMLFNYAVNNLGQFSGPLAAAAYWLDGCFWTPGQ